MVETLTFAWLDVALSTISFPSHRPVNAIETGPGFSGSSSRHVTLGAIEYLPVADRRTT